MFKLFNQIPDGQDNIAEICDYLEVKAILSTDHKISINDIVKDFLRSADEQEDSGVEDYADDIRQKVELVSSECLRRNDSSRNQYPFTLEFNSEVIRFSGLTTNASYLYVYLLFATRLDMNKNKKFNDIDGTALLELISSEVSKNYFGIKSKAFVVGTALEGGFQEKINQLCTHLGEGLHFHNANGGPVHENDGGLDIVVWIDFSDKNPSKFIGFGQCKTGTSWEDHIAKLNAEAFCKQWLGRQPVLTPIRLFFISDVLRIERWYKTTVKAGLFFDRLRIVDHIPDNFPETLINSIRTWTASAIALTHEKFN